MEVTAIWICCISGWVLTYPRQIWSKYRNLLYFITYVKFISEFAVDSKFCVNSNYADGFQMNMPHNYLGACLLWSLLWWTMSISAIMSLAWTWWFNTSLHWISVHSHLTWWLKSGLAWGRTQNFMVDLVTLFWHETLKRLNGLPTAISSQTSTQHWRQKLSQRLCAQRSGCKRVPDEVEMSVPLV